VTIEKPMNSIENKNETETLVFGGTLGDAFIVLCKLYSQHKKYGTRFRLIRYDLFPQYDQAISDMFKMVPCIEYLSPCRVYVSIPDLISAIKQCPHKYINTKWHKDDLETYPLDYDSLDPFPEIAPIMPSMERSKIAIGIQLYCGATGHNFRGFSLAWLKKLRKHFPANEYILYLIGKGNGCYNVSSIENICRENDILNKLDTTSFSEWLGFIKSMDYFVSFEGLSAFYAMSQRIRTLMYNQQQYAHHVHGSIHPFWKNNSLIININTNAIKRKLRYMFLKNNIYNPKIPFDFFCNAKDVKTSELGIIKQIL